MSGYDTYFNFVRGDALITKILTTFKTFKNLYDFTVHIQIHKYVPLIYVLNVLTFTYILSNLRNVKNQSTCIMFKITKHTYLIGIKRGRGIGFPTEGVHFSKCGKY